MDIGQTEVETMIPALSNTESTNAELQNSAEQENSTEPCYPTRNRNRPIRYVIMYSYKLGVVL